MIFNLACCVFAVIWSSAEQRYQPGLTFYPTRPPLASNDPEPLFVTFPTSHPPAALRYMRFRDFQGDLTLRFASHNPGAAPLSAQVDAHSFLLLDELADLDPRFYQLRVHTPGISKTPEVKRLIAYEERSGDRHCPDTAVGKGLFRSNRRSDSGARTLTYEEMVH